MAGKVPFLAPTFVQHEVGKDETGEPVVLKFYPVSLSMAFKLRVIAKPLAEALTALFSPTDTDSKLSTNKFDRIKDKDGGETVGGEQAIREAVSPDMARFRLDARTKAMQTLIETLTDKRNVLVIGELLCDSLRDNYERGKWNIDDAEALVNALDGPSFANYLNGLKEANKSIFGPLGERASEASRLLGTKLIEARNGKEVGTVLPFPTTSPATS